MHWIAIVSCAVGVLCGLPDPEGHSVMPQRWSSQQQCAAEAPKLLGTDFPNRKIVTCVQVPSFRQPAQ